MRVKCSSSIASVYGVVTVTATEPNGVVKNPGVDAATVVVPAAMPSNDTPPFATHVGEGMVLCLGTLLSIAVSP